MEARSGRRCAVLEPPLPAGRVVPPRMDAESTRGVRARSYTDGDEGRTPEKR